MFLIDPRNPHRLCFDFRKHTAQQLIIAAAKTNPPSIIPYIDRCDQQKHFGHPQGQGPAEGRRCRPARRAIPLLIVKDAARSFYEEVEAAIIMRACVPRHYRQKT
jgi:hypothetical protein